SRRPAQFSGGNLFSFRFPGFTTQTWPTGGSHLADISKPGSRRNFVKELFAARRSLRILDFEERAGLLGKVCLWMGRRYFPLCGHDQFHLSRVELGELA